MDDFVANGNVIYFFMDHGAPAFIPIFFEIFYPVWNYAKIMVDIIHRTSKEWDPLHKTWTSPGGYSFQHLFGENSHNYVGYGVIFTTQPTYISFLLLFFNIFFYFLLFVIVEIILNYFDFNMIFHYCGFLCPCWKSDIQKVFDEDIKRENELASNLDNEMLLRTVGLSKTFYQIGRPTRAVEDLSLAVEKNSVFAIIGENGSGKTTTCYLLSGVHRATKGEVYMDNKSLTSNLGYLRRRLGLCHQSSTLYDNLTAREHIQLFCQIKGLDRKKIAEEAEFLLKKVSLWNVRNSYTKTFSGGMKRRLAVAIACVGLPKVIILDESTIGIDPFSRYKIWKFILDLKKNHTVFLTTHNLEEVERLCDRVGILSHGKLKCVGNRVALKQKYGNCIVLRLSAVEGGDDDVRNALEEHFKSEIEDDGFQMEISNDTVGMFILKIDRSLIQSLTRFLEKLESGVYSHLITHFGVNSISMEDVFVKAIAGDDYEKYAPHDTELLIN